MNRSNEEIEASIAEVEALDWRPVPGTTSQVGYNAQGEAVAIGCGRRTPDPVRVAQDLMETGTQDFGTADSWA